MVGPFTTRSKELFSTVHHLRHLPRPSSAARAWPATAIVRRTGSCGLGGHQRGKVEDSVRELAEEHIEGDGRKARLSANRRGAHTT